MSESKLSLIFKDNPMLFRTIEEAEVQEHFVREKEYYAAARF